MKALLPALVAMVSLLGQGCRQFEVLEKDLELLDTLSRLPVKVAGVSLSDGPVVVTLMSPVETGFVISGYGVASSRGTITLPAPPGPHYLVGYQDLNGNFEYDAGEPAGRYGAPELLVLKPGVKADRVTLDLTLEDGSREAWSEDFRELAEAATLDPRAPVMGHVVAMDDPRFDLEVGSQGQWAPAAFISAGNRTGVYFLEDYDPGKPPVLLVHGIGGSPRNFEAVAEALRSAGLQPWLFYYPSGVRLENAAGLLARSIRELQAAYAPDTLQLVGHSMGGVVAREAVNMLSDEGDARFCSRLVTLSAPFGGLETAELGVEFAPAVVPSWRDLAPESPFLESLADPLPEGMPHVLFFTIGGPPINVGNSDGVVSLASQLRPEIQDQAEHLIGVDASHVGILRDDRALRLLVEVLKR